MEIFLDTANIHEIEQAVKLGCLQGVTTNPSIIVREKKPFRECINNILDIDKSLKLLVEITSRDTDKMVKEAQEIVKLSSNIIIKIPAIKNGLRAVNILSNVGIPTTMTLVFNSNQAIMASLAGAAYVAPFIGRLEDINIDGLQFIRNLKEIFTVQSITTKIITASIRSPNTVSQLFHAGSDIVTVPSKVFLRMMEHPLTASGLLRFEQDWKAVPNI